MQVRKTQHGNKLLHKSEGEEDEYKNAQAVNSTDIQLTGETRQGSKSISRVASNGAKNSQSLAGIISPIGLVIMWFMLGNYECHNF